MDSESTSCCGMNLLTNLVPDEKELGEVLSYAKGNHKGLMLATINGYELKRKYGVFLSQQGFVKIKRFKNPNSGNWVHVYMRDLKDVKPKNDDGEDY